VEEFSTGLDNCGVLLQIAGKYKSDYQRSLEQCKKDRIELSRSLSLIPGLRVIPSQANYIMCEVLRGYAAGELAAYLLDRYGILIKDLSSKRGVSAEFIRVTVRNSADNEVLVSALREVLA